jgi:tetratricopeptide (TPR) repeat protein
MSIFQVILLAISAYFAYEVYKHIQTLQDKPPSQPKPFDDGGIQSDIQEFTPKTIYTVAELISQADAAFQNGDLEKALMILREANYSKPYDAEILYKIGYIHYKQGRYQDAIEALEDALKGDDKDPAIYSLMASSYRANNNLPQAVKMIQEALALEKENPVYHFNYANILQDLGHIEDAIQEYKKVLLIDPSIEEAKKEIEKLENRYATQKNS